MKALDEAVLRLAGKQYGVFSRGQALSLGASRHDCDHRLQNGRWLTAGHAGVYVLAAQAVTWHQRVMAATLAGPPGTVASHRSAAVLHGVREGTAIEVTVPPGANRRLGIMVHRGRLDRRDRGVVQGIPATAVDRTLVDLAAVVPDDALEQALEAAVRLGLTTAERVQQRLDELARPGRRGVARLRRVLARSAKGRPAGSEVEVKLIQLLRRAGLTGFVRQHEVVVGRCRYFLDVAVPERRLAIEIDGVESHSGPARFQADRTRQNALVLAGWTVLRFTWADVMERPEQVIAAIAMALAA